MINEIEGMQMTGEEDLSAVLDALTARYPKAGIVMTLGGDGCVYQDASRRFYQDSFRVPVKDTTGAGDTFTGYFIAGLVSGMDVRECLMVASRAAAIAVTRPGASSSIPTKRKSGTLIWNLKDQKKRKPNQNHKKRTLRKSEKELLQSSFSIQR